jgi:1-phosphatidylinositol-4-phosphate 5-kinase
MHFNPDMPSFLTDENLPIYSQSVGILHLDPASQFDLAREKVNGDVLLPHHHSQSTTNESFDESSTHSTHASEASDKPPHVNGDGSRPPSMSSTSQNGSLGGGETETDTKKPLSNGISMILVDRTVPPLQPLTNGTKESSDSAAPSPSRDVPPRTSMSSAASESIQQSPVEMYVHHGKGDIRPVDNAVPTLETIPSNDVLSAFPTASAPSLAPTSPSTPSVESSQRNQQAPHRFSSPPTYQASGALPGPSSGATPQPGGGLKHRHTLEVPKVTPGRGSRDGIDAAYSSGRFSPTAATAGGRRASLSLVRRNTRSLHSDLPRDEIAPDEDALRWAEAYRQKRASKRKRRELEDDDRVLVGTKVDESHANWVTAYNMLTGIRVSVSRTNAKLDRPLTDEDFEAKQKSTFDM